MNETVIDTKDPSAAVGKTGTTNAFQLEEATINPVVFSENNSQAIFLNPVGGNGRQIFSQTDGTSESYVFGKNNTAGNAIFQNSSGPTWDTLGPGGAPMAGGVVDEFDANGNFIKRIATGGDHGPDVVVGTAFAKHHVFW